MANVVNLNITPLVPLQTDSYTLACGTSRPPLAPPPNKRLRSCLSPARSRPSTPFEDRNDSLSGYTSRSASYGSERSKSVRWEGEVPVTSYFDTWSREDYDRTPLEAPSAEERACVLPERNSRCMTRSYQCFLSDSNDEYALQSPSPIHSSPLSSPALAALDEALTAIHELPGEDLDSDDELFAHQEDVDCEADADDYEEEDEEEDETEEEWDECMKRRMMFLQFCRQDADDRQPQFDGYRSISSTIVDVLRSVGCDQEPQVASGNEAMVSAENLALVAPCTVPPTTPSLSSASTSEESEAETLVHSDNIPLVSPAAEELCIKLTIRDDTPVAVSITPTAPLSPYPQ